MFDIILTSILQPEFFGEPNETDTNTIVDTVEGGSHNETSLPEQEPRSSWLGRAFSYFTGTDDDFTDYTPDYDDYSSDEGYYVEDESGYLTPKWIHYATKVADFSESVVGSKLIETGKGMVAENAGMLIGAAFPEVAVGYRVGKSIASNLVKESEDKSMVVEGAGVAAALTAAALTKGLTYLTGVPMESMLALDYMVTAAGTIAGGMNGLEVAGKEVPNDYIPRTAAYIVTTGVVGKGVEALSSLPLPGPVSATVAVSGSILKPLTGMAAYYGPETAQAVDNYIHAEPAPQNEPNLYDLGEFVKNVAKNAHGDTSAFATSLTENVVESPLITSILQMLLKQSIDAKVGTNALVRAVNDFAMIIQENSIMKKIKELKATPDELKKDALKHEIAEQVAKKYELLEKMGANYIQKKSDPFVASIVDQIVDLMGRKEKEYMGMELSDTEQTRVLLEALIPSLIPMIGIYAKREIGASKELTSEEIETFYQNFNAFIFAPYNDYSLVRGAQGLISMAIPFMQSQAQFIPALLSTKIGEAFVDPIITLDDDPEFAMPRVDQPTAEEKSKKSFWASLKAIFTLSKVFGAKNFIVMLTDFFAKKVKKSADSSEPDMSNKF